MNIISMFRIMLIMMVSSITLLGCQAPPDLKKLQDEKGALQNQLGQARQQINSLQADKKILQQDVAELNRVVSVLGQEKSSRVQESTNLRGQVRTFVQQQIDGLKQFLLASNLLDYIGGELVERTNVDEKSLLIVDLLNTVPSTGSLTGVSGYFQQAGTFTVKVLRPVADKLVVVWASQALNVEEGGLNRINFPVSVGVEKGDTLAYYFSTPGLVSFDTGTGSTRYLNNDINVGSMISPSSLQGVNAKRAYAIGIYGLLNSQ